LDIQGVALPVVVLESLGDFIEVPLLGSNILSPSLQPNVVGSMAFNDSLHWHSGSNIEWSVDMEAEFLVETLGSSSRGFVNVKNLPPLVGSSYW
jgi:hypothetical protein